MIYVIYDEYEAGQNISTGQKRAKLSNFKNTTKGMMRETLKKVRALTPAASIPSSSEDWDEQAHQQALREWAGEVAAVGLDPKDFKPPTRAEAKMKMPFDIMKMKRKQRVPKAYQVQHQKQHPVASWTIPPTPMKHRKKAAVDEDRYK